MWKWAAWHRDVTGNLQIWSPPGSRCFQKCFSRISICGRRRWRTLWWNYSPGSDTPKSVLIRGYRGLVPDCAAGSDTYEGSMDAGDSVVSISTIVFSFDGCVALVVLSPPSFSYSHYITVPAWYKKRTDNLLFINPFQSLSSIYTTTSSTLHWRILQSWFIVCKVTFLFCFKLS